MRWQKLGMIFDLSKHALPAGCRSFAQSPQALVLDDRIRIYFSTRTQDEPGKYVSQVTFVEFDLRLERILGVSDRAVMTPGALGCFDEHGIFPMNVLRRGDAILAYTTGWSRRVSVSVETSIGLAVSHDGGATFERHGAGPVLTASLHEPCLVGDAFVRLIRGVFHMWYIFGTGWRRYAKDAPPDRTYKIGHATSSDGIAWRKEEGRAIIADRLGDTESQALPTVLDIDGVYHMLFCYRESFDFRTHVGRGYRIGHATSADLETWARDDDAAGITGAPEEWDSSMQCYPHLFACGDEIYVLYNGNEFGRGGFGAARLVR